MAARNSPRSRASREDESAPLVDQYVLHIRKAYGTEAAGKVVECLPKNGKPGSVVADYEPLKFSTMRVLTATKGTILKDYILFVEQGFITLIFMAAALPVYYYFNKEVDSVGSGGHSIRRWLDSQEGRMREFAMILMVLASLLLSFYTAMAVGRWWVIRAAGVGGIKSAAMELEMLISQAVTQEAQVLDAIRRYARASLFLVFIWRRDQLGEMEEMITSQGILTPQEARALRGTPEAPWNHVLHETIWSWQSAIVCTLYREGKIQSDQLLRTLLERCSDGRSAIQCIHTHLAVKIPMQYVHLLGFLVKMHNVILSVIMGSLFGAAIRNSEIIICVQLAGRTLILPLLFNAILLINAELADPFDGGPTDFPALAYSKALEMDGSSFVKASQNQPDWMAKRNPLPV